MEPENASGAIMDYLARVSPERLRTLLPSEIAQATGVGMDRISKLLWSLEHTGRISLLRDGRAVVGVREITRLEGRQGRKVQRAPGEPPKPREAPASVKTPLLDGYIADKEQAEQFATQSYSGRLQIKFQEDPLAEEAIKLREALVRMENQWRELQTQYKMLVYEKQKLADDARFRAAKKVEEAQREMSRN